MEHGSLSRSELNALLLTGAVCTRSQVNTAPWRRVEARGEAFQRGTWFLRAGAPEEGIHDEENSSGLLN